jgi:hypothetical protein
MEAWIVVSAPKVRVEVVDHVLHKCLGLIVPALSRRILYYEMAK